MLTSFAGPWFEATPRRKNWTVKTPCLKCGLIHDEATAICDGYVGFDPDETAGDSKKQAAARIRAILAAVPIESHRPVKTRAAAAAAATDSEKSPDPQPPATGRTENSAAEVPEWRREVTERLESYRSKRERQARQGRDNQSVLAFRVHSRTETLEAEPPVQAAPAVLDAPVMEPSAPEALEAPETDTETPAAALHAAVDAAAPPIPKPGNGNGTHRTYQPIEETEATADLTAEPAGVAAEIPENGNGNHAAATEADELPAAEPAERPAAIPVAGEPSVVLADATTLEVHADPVELADVQSDVHIDVQSDERSEMQIGAPPAIDSAPLAAIPAIDTEYWRAVPGVDAEAEECGSLTSGFESPAAAPEAEETSAEELVAEEDPARAEPRAELEAEEMLQESAATEALAEPEPELEEEDETELAAVAEAHAVEETAEPALSAHMAEEPAMALDTDAGAAEDSLFPSEPAVDGSSTGDRRSALRTAARPLNGAPPERIEIRVPQPVFDFTPAEMATLQPQDEALPVAELRERRCAALLDAAMLGFTLAGFFLAFHLAGGEFSFSRVGVAVSAVAGFLIYALYVLLFTFVGGTTPGMVLRGLRVVCFDGRPPETVELAWRSFGYLLSAAAGMLGFLWSAWDEHGLSWHDRISQTYITYADPEVVPAPLAAP